MDEMEDLSLWEEKRSRRAWPIGLLVITVMYSYLPLAVLSGLAKLFKGPGFIAPGLLATFGIWLPVFTAGVYLAIVSPFVRGKFLIAHAKPSRMVFAAVIWSFPLLSFAYWRGDFAHSLHAYDLGVFVLAALAIPLVVFWRTGNEGVLALGVALIAFIPMFVVEDILGPFSPLWVFASEGPGLYSLRTLSVAAALVLACMLPVPQLGRVKDRALIFQVGCGLLAIASALVGVGELFSDPALLGPRLLTPELNWVGYLGLAYFVSRKERSGRVSFVIVSVIQSASLVAQLVYGIWNPDASYWGQARLFTMVLGLALIGVELRRRERHRRLISVYPPPQNNESPDSKKVTKSPSSISLPA